uniref:Major capsid protein N-terminal domain-containing protein n=1 Tax=viral metagenome TaxID=1070528 RepID=A0A6C0I3E0_9ZZZZ
MAGGLLNLVAYGNQNIILNSNPKKTFFKSTYAKYTNFGLQKFRIDFDGQRNLRMSEDSKFTFYIPRYAELLMDTYLVVTLPNIWSPVLPPATCNESWTPYEFKWIDNLGTQMIKDITISVGGQTLQKITGGYLLALVQRNFNGTERDLYNRMTGNIPELNNPAYYSANNGKYPNAFYNYTNNPAGVEPSIRFRKLYIPINAWFSMSSKMAFPLVALQYNTLQIDITLRPVRDLFVIRDVSNVNTGEETLPSYFPEYTTPNYIQPNFNDNLQQFHRFIQPPPNVELDYGNSTRSDWNADIHLMSTYCFLSSDEAKQFASMPQQYLIKSVYEWNYENVTGSRRVWLQSTLGMVSSWLFYFQRSDAYLRNEWSNYSNWPYSYKPVPLIPAPNELIPCSWTPPPCDDPSLVGCYGPGWNPTQNEPTGFFMTQSFSVENQKDILLNLGILLDGKYRENILDAGVYNYLEKYTSSRGSAPDGLYCYNFCLNTEPTEFQPSGAINASKFSTIELEFTTFYPPLDPSANFLTICDPETGVPIGVNKPTWRIYDYNYNLTIFEERFNMLTFVGGNCGLMYAR